MNNYQNLNRCCGGSTNKPSCPSMVGTAGLAALEF